MGRFYRAATRTECIEGRKYQAAALELTLYNALGEKIQDKLTVPIDTGYDGVIMLPTDLHEFFSIAELPKGLWGSYRTLTGTVSMRAARTRASIADEEVDALVESPIFGKGKLLLGREALNRLIITMDGVRKQTCLCEEANR